MAMLRNADLAFLAFASNQQAQLELGIRFEHGRGVPKDLKKAKKLYTLAAADTYDDVTYYEPSSEAGKPGIVRTREGPLKERGLKRAAQRLAALNAELGAE